jgi:hypothetical protein
MEGTSSRSSLLIEKLFDLPHARRLKFARQHANAIRKELLELWEGAAASGRDQT